MLITTFVFIGIEGASVYSRYAKKREDVGKATVMGFLSVLSIFALGDAVELRRRAAARARRHPPAVDGRRFESVVGDWGEVFISVAVIVSVLGAYLAWTLMAAEVMYIPARQDETPAVPRPGERGRHADHRAGGDLARRPGAAGADALRHGRAELPARPGHQPRAAALPAGRGVRAQARPDGGVVRRGPAGVRRKETIVAGAATAYTLFLFDAAGMKFVLLSTVILAPASAALRQGPQRARPAALLSARDRSSP